MKKSLFFLSLMQSECEWKVMDTEHLLSPIDYHELRGHLRIGTVNISNRNLLTKIEQGLPISEEDDIKIREQIQGANNRIAKTLGISSSAVHYLLWNIFRNCCPRDSNATHCHNCGESCYLPPRYAEARDKNSRCLFSPICSSVNNNIKVIEPPYIGHFY